MNAQTLRETHGSFLSFSACSLQIFFSRLQHSNLRGMLHGVCSCGIIISYIWFKLGEYALHGCHQIVY